MISNRRAVCGLSLAGALVVFAHAAAQDWPARPLRWIAAQPPGSALDITARLLAERLVRSWGQQVVVDNRAGGQSVIGALAAARAAPDGYSYFVATPAAVASNVYTFKSLPYDPVRDFMPVAMIGESPFVVAAQPKLPATTIGELVALERAQPGKLAMANQGARTFGGMVGAMLNQASGMRLLQVPYNSPGLAIQDTLGGRAQVVLLSSGALAAFLKRGDLRALAVTSARRVPGLEHVPTLSESFPGFEYSGWFALLAPSGTPPAIVQRVNRDLQRLLADPDVVQKLGDLGVMTEGAGTPEMLGKFLAAERVRWAKLVREIGLEPE
ncbi:MAG TPA: tripartite tricarboxylate transporter substrate-binding protein [Burkholderiales bacterium]|nr:tripartite tricarboxylate transporter substrate-binding protein [Burkholderiales bacterium]